MQPELMNEAKQEYGYYSVSPLRRSPAFGKVTEAMAAARKDFKPVKKDKTNPFFKSKYADLQAVIDATAPALAQCGLVVIQSPSTMDTGRGRSVMVTTLLAHSSGEWFESDLILPADKDDKLNAQTLGSAITYAKRYALQGMLNVSAEDDDDGNAAVTGGAQTVKMPQKKTAFTADDAEKRKGTQAEVKPLSFAQKFWAEAKKTGRTEEQVRAYLGQEGYESTTEVHDTKVQAQLMDWAMGK